MSLYIMDQSVTQCIIYLNLSCLHFQTMTDYLEELMCCHLLNLRCTEFKNLQMRSLFSSMKIFSKLLNFASLRLALIEQVYDSLPVSLSTNKPLPAISHLTIFLYF